MERGKVWAKLIFSILGAVIIVVGGTMFILEQLQPLAVYGVNSWDALLLVMLLLDGFWMVYLVFVYRRYDVRNQQGSASSPHLKALATLSRTTGLMSVYGVVLVAACYIAYSGGSLVTPFLQSVLVVFSVILLVANHETSYRLLSEEKK